MLRATVEAYVSPGIVLTDVREYAGTGFGNETAHSIRLDLRVYGISSNFQYIIPTYPPGYVAFNIRKYASKSFSIDAAYVANLTKEGQPVTVPSFSITADTNFQYRFPGAANRTVVESWGLTIKWDVQNPDGSVTHDITDAYSASYSTVLSLTRQNVSMVALDSRRVYGQPNLDGEIPADPNADARNPSFANWVYKGGLFVGAASGADQSGTARIQGWLPTATGGLMSSLTLRALGQPQNYAAPTLKVFAPASSDPNLATTSTTATWANRWDLSAARTLGDPTVVEAMPSGEYYRVKMLQVPTKVGIALTDETNGSGLWQYFASAAYETGYPLADSQPRLWTVSGATTSDVHTWTYWNGTVPPGGGTTLLDERATGLLGGTGTAAPGRIFSEEPRSTGRSLTSTEPNLGCSSRKINATKTAAFGRYSRTKRSLSGKGQGL